MPTMIFEKNKLSWSINISIALTLVIAVGIRYAVPTGTKTYVLSFVQSAPEANDLSEVIAGLVQKSTGLNKSELENIARETEPLFTQAQIREIFTGLTKDAKNSTATTLGLYILENSTNRYKLRNMTFLVGKYYREGRYADKDLTKAKHFLSDIALKNDPNTQFQLGLLYLDKSFAEYSASLGIEFIQAAADNGLAAAQKKLLDLKKSNELQQ
jgi:hypothetical protein